MKSLLDPTFRYVPSAETDIRKTFARVRREMRTRERAPDPRRSAHADEPLPPPNLKILFPAHKRAS